MIFKEKRNRRLFEAVSQILAVELNANFYNLAVPKYAKINILLISFGLPRFSIFQLSD